MNKKEIFRFLLAGIFIIATLLPAFSQNESDDAVWQTGHITSVGKDFIKIDRVRYEVSPDVVITGEKGNDLGSDLRALKVADEIMFKEVKDIIIEIRILRLTS